jgi:hypothetical protein
MAHEKLQGSIVRIRKVIYSLVQADVSESIILDLWQVMRAKRSSAERYLRQRCTKNSLAASMNPLYNEYVSTGSGSSRNHSFSVEVIVLMSDAHS